MPWVRVQAAHRGQWLSKWAIELSWPAFVALGLQQNNYVVVGAGGWTPGPVAAAPEPPRTLTFAEVPDGIGGGFLDFWESNGGLPIFGFPLTPEIQEDGMTVQYFERAVFEWHDGKVLLRRLGAHSLGHPEP